MGLLREVRSNRREPADVVAYRKHCRELVRNAQTSLAADELPRAQAIIEEMQATVLGKLHIAGMLDERSWAARRERTALAAIDHVIHEYATRFGRQLGKSLGAAYKIGADTVDESVKYAVLEWSRPTITAKELNLATRYKPSLIRGMDEYAHDKIGKTIIAYTRTGKSPQELMQVLAGRITTEGTPFHSVAYRAELITRTEMSRVQNMGAQDRMRSFSDEHPEYGAKQALITCGDAGRICDECQANYENAPYPDGCYDLDDEDAPDVPTHPACLCAWSCEVDLSHLGEERESRQREKG